VAGAIDHQDSFAVFACGCHLARPRLIRDRLLMKESGQSHRIILAAANRPHREMMNNSDISAVATSCAANASA
jgi:hypothetical protein